MIIYVVAPGDTLFSISGQFSIPQEKLIEENGIPNPENLVTGQAIVIPDEITPSGLPELSVNGYAYPNISEETLQKTLPYLTYLTPFTYGFNEDGSLILLMEEQILSLAQNAGVLPVLLISTLTPEGTFSNALASLLLNNPSLQDTLLDNLVSVMKEKGYQALDVDFEYVLPEDKDAYLSFLALAAERVHAEGWPLFVALAPKTSSTQRGLLYESHDYYGIGRIADYVLLMTYEWGYTFGPPMAVAPINQVRRVLDYAITEIPHEKIFMGIPNYGYDWPLPYVRGVTRASSLGNVEAIELAARYNVTIEYDTTAQSPYFYYTDAERKEHVVWFEDARSIEAKLNLILEYGFYGAGYWNIMKWFPQNWLVLSSLFQVRKP